MRVARTYKGPCRWPARPLPPLLTGSMGALEPLVIPQSPKLGLHARSTWAQGEAIDWGPSPQDFFGAPQTADSGERRLLLAVLTDGISTCFAPKGRERRLARRQALSWVGSMDSGRLSFRTVCEGLGIEPTRVQQAILDRVGS